MTELQLEMYNLLISLPAEAAVDLFLNWNGNQLLTKEFYEELIDQGYIEEEGE